MAVLAILVFQAQHRADLAVEESRKFAYYFHPVALFQNLRPRHRLFAGPLVFCLRVALDVIRSSLLDQMAFSDPNSDTTLVAVNRAKPRNFPP
jgi:hypothetical protein